MSSDVAIKVQGVSKAYRIWQNPGARLVAPAIRSLARLFPPDSAPHRALVARAGRYYREFYALEDVSFEVRRGESVGIIGKNGSGKSTLLQIIVGTLTSTAGSVEVNGRVAALLELGSGFNPEFTGRENVFLNGAVLGLSRRQIEDRFDDIAAFADIGDFIDQPVKTYSSGMQVRLAFSLQMAVEPEILIVDEALAVGDAQFVAKCINRISDFIRKGHTLLFVSHEVGLVKQLTSRALFLDHGRQVSFGTTTEIVLAYTNSMAVQKAALADPDRYAADDAPYTIEGVKLSRLPDSSPAQSLAFGDPAQLTIRLAPRGAGAARLVLSVYNYMGIIVFCSEADLPATPASNRSLVVTVAIPRLRLAPGSYRINFAVRKGIEIVAWARNALHFQVSGPSVETYIYREDLETSFTFSDLS
jgi:lipopolysaccharide transport system ATP-binding protein